MLLGVVRCVVSEVILAYMFESNKAIVAVREGGGNLCTALCTPKHNGIVGVSWIFLLIEMGIYMSIIRLLATVYYPNLHGLDTLFVILIWSCIFFKRGLYVGFLTRS